MKTQNDDNKNISLTSSSTNKSKFKKVFKIVMLVTYLVLSIAIVFGTLFSFKNKTASADVNFPSVPPVGDSYYPNKPNSFYLPVVYNGISFSKSVIISLGQPSGPINTLDGSDLTIYFFDSKSSSWDWFFVNSVDVQNGSPSGSTAILTFNGRAGTMAQIQYTPLGEDKYQVYKFTINHSVVPANFDYFGFVVPNVALPAGSANAQLRYLLYRSTRSGFYQVGYDEGYNSGYNQGVIDGGNQQLNKLNPVSYFLEPVSVFLSTPIFGNLSIGAALSIVMFVGVALIFIKMFAGG